MAASTARIPRTPRAPNRTAASAGPITSELLLPRPKVEFAPSRSLSATSRGIADREAGAKTWAARARSPTAVSSTGRGGKVSARPAIKAACTRSQLIITRRRA